LELKPTISISFLDHVLFPQTPAYHLHFRLLEAAQHFPLTADLAFHLLELPKFTKSATELASGLDVWLYFLRHAAKIDIDALPAPLQQPLVRRALEELKMLSQTDLERERYEARRKAQLDENTRMKVSRMEGREEGRQEGEKIGLARAVRLFERLLQRPETPTEQLTALSLEDLTRLADELQALLQQHR
jgi:predicted transposase/invertase (TIGR01784 family)